MVVGVLSAVALVAAALLIAGCGGSGGGYTVRAIFDDAANIIPGETVKIDGVKVGIVGAVTATPQQKAAVVLNITSRRLPGLPRRRELHDRTGGTDR